MVDRLLIFVTIVNSAIYSRPHARH